MSEGSKTTPTAVQLCGAADPRVFTELRGHFLYRLLDEHGTLLYIGITANCTQRFRQHQKSQHWWPEVASCVIEAHATKPSVVGAERLAILRENPIYNKRREQKRALRGRLAESEWSFFMG